MPVRVSMFLVLLLCCVACCTAPQPWHSTVSVIEAPLDDGAGVPPPWAHRTNLLVDPELARSPEVVDLLRSIVVHLAEMSIPDSACFLALGNDSTGAWIDPPAGLLLGLGGMKTRFRPISDADPEPVPRPLPGQVVFWQEPSPLCSLALEVWSPDASPVVLVRLSSRSGSKSVTIVAQRTESGWSINE